MEIDVKSLTPAGQGNYQKIMDGTAVVEELGKMTQDPMKYNEALFFEILKKNEATEFGKKYGFSEISSIEEYQKRVPVSKYDDYADAILRMTEDGETDLISAYPINHYNKSSGTMGNPKRLPMSDREIEISNKYLTKYIYGLLGKKLGMDWIDGKTMSLTESASEI